MVANLPYQRGVEVISPDDVVEKLKDKNAFGAVSVNSQDGIERVGDPALF